MSSGRGSSSFKDKKHFWSKKDKDKSEDSAKQGSSKRSSKHGQRDTSVGASGDRMPTSKSTSKGGNGKPGEDDGSLDVHYTSEPVHITRPIVATSSLTTSANSKVCINQHSLCSTVVQLYRCKMTVLYQRVVHLWDCL